MLKNLLTTVAVTAICICNANAQSFDRPKEGSMYQADYDFEQTAYNQCTSKIINGSDFGYINCLNQEIKRQEAGMNYFYTELLKQEQYQKWNTSTSINAGNIRDMRSQYVAYRDRFCSMYAIGMMNFYKNIEFGRKDCIMKLNSDTLRTLQRFYSESLADFSTDEDFALEEKANAEYNASH